MRERELVRSAAAETSQPTSPTGAALAPGTLRQPRYRTADARPLDAAPGRRGGTLVAARAARGVVPTSLPLPISSPLVEAGDEGQGWTANLLGVLVMALGLLFA